MSKWTKIWSKSKGRYYYYDQSTNTSVWEEPSDFQEENTKTSNDEGQRAIKRARIETAYNNNNNNNVSGTSAPPRREEARHEYVAPISGNAADIPSSSSALLAKYPRIIPMLPISKLSMWERTDIQVNSHLQSVYTSGTILDKNNAPHKFKDCTNPIQGRHLYNLVKENKFSRTLEVGLAMGASAVWMCQGLKDNNFDNEVAAHYAIDPNQTTQYDNIGRLLVQRAGLGQYLNVLETTSYRALPKLLEDVLAGKIPRFHLIYIDGWHTFDYTLVDFFYADLLLEVNGVIVLDDIKHTPVKKCLSYINTNYPHYDTVPRTPCYDPTNPSISSSQATFIKTAEDRRTWNAHEAF